MVAKPRSSTIEHAVSDEDRDLIKATVKLFARGQGLAQAAATLGMPQDVIQSILDGNEEFFDKSWRKADTHTMLSWRSSAALILRNGLLNDNEKLAQRSADILCRVESRCAHLDLQREKLEFQKELVHVRKL